MKVDVGCKVLTIADVAEMCGGKVCLSGDEYDSNMPFNAVCTDSREADNGSLFVALKGERVDGHDYMNVALERGGQCVLCQRIPENIKDKSYVAIVVEDTLQAIGDIAKAYDRRVNHKKIAITGSVGKTTTKEVISSVLAEHLRVHKTEGNYNSTLGMPLSLLTMTKDTEVSVLEMGMSGRGEIEYLSRIAEPDIAVITNIGSSHMEYLGSQEEICKAKLEILTGLKEDGVIFLNGDDDFLRNRAELEGRNCIYVGYGENCDVRAINVQYGNGKTCFDVTYNGVTIEGLMIPEYGDPGVYAALFAYAIAVHMNLDLDVIKRGLSNFKNVGMRRDTFPLGNITVIQDCYNASPESTKQSIALLSHNVRQKGYGRMIAVLGDMYELGDYTKTAHEQVGLEFARRGGVELYTFGELAGSIADGAINGGISAEHIFQNSDLSQPEITGEMLLDNLQAGDVLLVKASRGARAERIVQYLIKNEAKL